MAVFAEEEEEQGTFDASELDDYDEQPAAISPPVERVINENVPERYPYHKRLHEAASRADPIACEDILEVSHAF